MVDYSHRPFPCGPGHIPDPGKRLGAGPFYLHFLLTSFFPLGKNSHYSISEQGIHARVGMRVVPVIVEQARIATGNQRRDRNKGIDLIVVTFPHLARPAETAPLLHPIVESLRAANVIISEGGITDANESSFITRTRHICANVDVTAT